MVIMVFWLSGQPKHHDQGQPPGWPQAAGAGVSGRWLKVASVPDSGQGGQTIPAVTAVTCPARTVAVVTPGWQPERLAMTV